MKFPLGWTVAALLAGCARPSSTSWPDVKARVRAEFPEVKQVSTSELAAWMADSSRPQPLLVDARSEQEFAVSRLPKARRATSTGELSEVKKDAPVVVYCSVGWRSSALAKKLQAAGYTQVWNLEGSIFEWANQGRPLEGGEKVHPYDEEWGKLLEPAKRSPL